MQMKCKNCGAELDEVEEKNKLSEEDQTRCGAAIDKIFQQIKQFDDYVLPAYFFGPGNLSAYVSPSGNQAIED